MVHLHRESEPSRADRLGGFARELSGPAGSAVELIDQVLEGDDPLTERQRTQLTQARDNVAFLHVLVADAMEVSRVLSPGFHLEASPQDMRAVVQEAVSRAVHLAAGKSINLVAELPGRALTVEVDRTKMLQVFANLISNAVKFSRPGSTVRVGARRTATGVEAWVSDQGSGMYPSDLPQLFRCPPRLGGRAWRATGAPGVGLYVVAAILRLHHGTIRVTTGKGRGTTFSFALPRAAPSRRAERE